MRLSKKEKENILNFVQENSVAREFDFDTGLQFNRNGYYNPEMEYYIIKKINLNEFIKKYFIEETKRSLRFLEIYYKNNFEVRSNTDKGKCVRCCNFGSNDECDEDHTVCLVECGCRYYMCYGNILYIFCMCIP